MPCSNASNLSEKARFLPLRFRQETADRSQIPTKQRLKHGKLHGYPGRISLVFLRPARCRSHHVAEIIERQSRHHGIEVDDADSFAGSVIEHNVIELGVIVTDTLGQVCIDKDACGGFTRQRKFNFRLC